MKQKKNAGKKVVIITTFILVIAVIALVILKMYPNTVETIGTASGKEENKIEQEKPKEETTSASLIMVGDNLVHSSIYKEAHRNADNKGYDFKPMLRLIKEKVKNYDIAYYNQETILGGSKMELSDYPCFNSPYEAGGNMLDAGFNLVSTASNHTMDRGEQAILNSRSYWDKQKEILAVGSYQSFEQRDELQIKQVNGITYTMLNYTYGTNGIPVPTGKEYLVNVWPTDLSINDPKRDIKYQAYKEKVK